MERLSSILKDLSACKIEIGIILEDVNDSECPSVVRENLNQILSLLDNCRCSIKQDDIYQNHINNMKKKKSCVMLKKLKNVDIKPMIKEEVIDIDDSETEDVTDDYNDEMIDYKEEIIDDYNDEIIDGNDEDISMTESNSCKPLPVKVEIAEYGDNDGTHDYQNSVVDYGEEEEDIIEIDPSESCIQDFDPANFNPLEYVGHQIDDDNNSEPDTTLDNPSNHKPENNGLSQKSERRKRRKEAKRDTTGNMLYKGYQNIEEDSDYECPEYDENDTTSCASAIKEKKAAKRKIKELPKQLGPSHRYLLNYVGRVFKPLPKSLTVEERVKILVRRHDDNYYMYKRSCDLLHLPVIERPTLSVKKIVKELCIDKDHIRKNRHLWWSYNQDEHYSEQFKKDLSANKFESLQEAQDEADKIWRLYNPTYTAPYNKGIKLKQEKTGENLRERISLRTLDEVLKIRAQRDPLANVKELFACDECEESFSKSSLLRSHMKKQSHKGLKCVCGKSFNRMDILRIHIRQHTGERPYSCEECGNSYPTTGSVITHQKKSHGQLSKIIKTTTTP